MPTGVAGRSACPRNDDGKSRGSKVRPGSREEDRKAQARQGSLASDASKSHQKTDEVAQHPAYWGSGTHRRASEGEDEKDWAPKAMQAEDTEARVQAKEASYAAALKTPNHTAHQGSGTCSPPGLTALFGLAALFGPTTSGKNKGKTRQGVSAANFSPATWTPTYAAHQGGGARSPQGSAVLLSGAVLFGSNTGKTFQGKAGQGVSAANFLSAQGPQYKEEAAIAHGVRGASHSHQMAGAWSTANAGYSNKATGDNDERNNDASLATCCDYVLTGQMPVRDAGGDAGMPRAATPALRGQRHPCDEGDNAGAMPATTRVQCWQ